MVSTEDLQKRIHEDMNEENVCMRVVVPYLIDILGWSRTELHAEYRLSNNERVDYAIIPEHKEEPSFLVEAKSIPNGFNQKQINKLSAQVNICTAKFGILTNGTTFKIIQNNEVIDQFSLQDEPNINVKSTQYSNKSETLTDEEKIEEFVSNVKNTKTRLPKRIIKSFIMQYISTVRDNKPLHIYLYIEKSHLEDCTKFISNAYSDILIKNNNTLIKNSVDPELLLYTNRNINKNLSKNKLENSFNSITKNETTLLPNDKPLLVLDTYSAKTENILNTFKSQIENLFEFDLSLLHRYDEKLHSEFKQKKQFNELSVSVNSDITISEKARKYIQKMIRSISPVKYTPEDMIYLSTLLTNLHSTSTIKEEQISEIRQILSFESTTLNSTVVENSEPQSKYKIDQKIEDAIKMIKQEKEEEDLDDTSATKEEIIDYVEKKPEKVEKQIKSLATKGELYQPPGKEGYYLA